MNWRRRGFGELRGSGVGGDGYVGGNAGRFRARCSRIRAGIPVGRVATTREIAGPVLFLCTPLAGFISGEVVNVNGGAVLVG